MATLTGIFWPMSTGLGKILLSSCLLRRGRERTAEETEKERKKKGAREDERQERREAENGRPANGSGVMSHRPVILKLPFNIPAASVVTRKEVRGHTSDFVEATTCLCSALRCTTPKSLVDEAR